MKIILEKNLVFGDQEEPILAKEVPERIKAKKAKKALDEVELDINLNLPMSAVPKLEARLDEKKRATLRIGNFKLGQHFFPPDIEAKGVPSLGIKSKTFAKPLQTGAILPDHLELRPSPQSLAAKLQAPPFFKAFVSPETQKIGNQATTIFSPDNRLVFCDTSYPWCTCGRVDSPVGQGSGVMVGPRHLLTVSHMIKWNSDGSAGWVRFRPAYCAPSAPFGDAWAVRTYYKYKVVGPTIDWTEGMYDYVVCVLDRFIGNWTGWMGSKGYTDAWDGRAYWTHVGYPGDITSGNRPTYQGGISLDGEFWEPDSHEAMANWADVWPGQSGGPFFAWWADGWPYVVAVQSSQNSNQNNASGGQDLVDLIIRARNEYP